MRRINRLQVVRQNVRPYRLPGVVSEKERDILEDNDITGSPLFLAIEDQVVLGLVKETPKPKPKPKKHVPKKEVNCDDLNVRFKHSILGPWLQIENEKD
jgi:hypothetical protein